MVEHPPPHLGLFYTEISDSWFFLRLLPDYKVFQVSSLWLSSIISCVSKNLSHFLLVIHFAVTQLLTALSLLLLWQKLSLPVLSVTIFSPTPSWCRKICLCLWYLQEQNLVSLGFVLFSIMFLFCCLYFFPSSDIRFTLLLFL